MPSRTDTAGNTKAFIYPVMDHWGEGSQSAPAQGRFEPPSGRIKIYPGPSTGVGELLPIGGSSAKTAPPRVGHPQGV